MSSGLNEAKAAADLFEREPSPPPAPAADHEGHRRRLKDRFLNGGHNALPDYELLELVLYAAIRRGDTKPLAKRLLAAFNGSFAEVINAPSGRLKEVHGVGDAVVEHLKIVQAAAQRLLQVELKERDVFKSWADVIGYCHAEMSRLPIEQFRILFLDKKSRLIANEVQQTGTIDHTPVYPRQVVKRALELSATAVILVHNHPSGDPTPSKADIDMTRQITEAGRPLNITVHDHLIVARGGYTSFREKRLL